jgi:transposase-like protein
VRHEQHPAHGPRRPPHSTRAASGSRATAHAGRGTQRHLPPFIPDTNAIEALNRQLREAVKTKRHFPTEDAARKLLYLAIHNAELSDADLASWIRRERPQRLTPTQ